MRLGNLRLGHACNSSSTHSVILTGEHLWLVDPRMFLVLAVFKSMAYLSQVGVY